MGILTTTSLKTHLVLVLVAWIHAVVRVTNEQATSSQDTSCGEEVSVVQYVIQVIHNIYGGRPNVKMHTYNLPTEF
jgi:hypothetical protein